jgi:hypothetical protein
LYEKLYTLGYEVYARYYEPGMAFCGVFDNGVVMSFDYSSMNADEIAEYLPEDLDDYFAISSTVADWESENQEIDLDDGLSATNE